MIRLEREGPVAVVWLDRPPVNALDEATVEQLGGVVDELAGDASVVAVVFRSAHDRFCAGADIAMIGGFLREEGGVDAMIAYIERLQDLYARIESLPQVTIAAIDGVATGGGLELALACDLRVAGRRVRLGLPEVNIGLLPGAGGTQRLSRIAGRATSLRTILTAELYTGEQAEGLGIVQWAVPDDEVQVHARALADGFAARSAASLTAVKRCVGLAPSDEGFRAEVDLSRELLENDATRRLIGEFLRDK